MGWADGAPEPVEPVIDISLKTCPFCGNYPQIEPWHGGPPTKVLISCSNDDCRVAPSVSADTRDNAATIWNTRAE